MLTDVYQTYCKYIIKKQIAYWFLRFPDYNKKHTAVSNRQQRMLTPYILTLFAIAAFYKIKNEVNFKIDFV